MQSTGITRENLRQHRVVVNTLRGFRNRIISRVMMTYGLILVQVHYILDMTRCSLAIRWQVFRRTYHLLLYAFFWVIPRRLNFICRRFGTLCSIFIGRKMRMEWTRLGTNLGYYMGKGLALKWPEPLVRRVTEKGGGRIRVEKQAVKGNDLHCGWRANVWRW